MKIFAIRDGYRNDNKNLAYLFYYEQSKTFYIEFPENADEWELPILLSSFVAKKEFTVDSSWSKIWVQQRIVPPDRQNLGQILRDNGLDDYDEFELLMLANGRCEQDECYLFPVKAASFPEDILARFEKHIDFAVPISNYHILVFFHNGKVKKCNVQEAFAAMAKKNSLYGDYSTFASSRVMPGGYGVAWGNIISYSYEQLYKNGQSILLTTDDFKLFVSGAILSSAEAAEELECSRQNIDDLVRRGKLHPIKTYDKNKLFWREEITRRKQR